MAKKYYVEIGARKRELRYTRQERIEIERRFECDIREFVYGMAFPMRDGKPTMGGRLEAQEALIWYGVRHIGGKITEDLIARELQKVVENGGSIYEPLSQAIVGMLASGLLGYTPDLADADAEVEEGKGEEPNSSGEATPIRPIKQAG